jgi:LAS superfamily LD-carboxypeptidase LdcB
MNSLSLKVSDLNANILTLSTALSSTTEVLQASIKDTNNSLFNALSIEQKKVGAITEQLGGVQNQYGTLSGTLTNLQKLAQTDPELLKKYSKAYFLNENYVPARLSEIPLTYQYSESKQMLIHSDILPHLIDMLKNASSSKINLYVSSAYRSFAEQKALKGNYSLTYGAGTANSFSADQGYSEHQLGTTLDMITSGLGGNIDGFESTPAFEWMQRNAYKYGFVLSYPKNNGYYVYEPWHWRFVGVKLATDIRNQDKTFYDLDQRKIDEYLVNIFD